MFGPKIFVDPFFYQNIRDPNCFGPNIFWPQIYLDPTLFGIFGGISLPSVALAKNISKKVSQENQNFPLKISYNSGCNMNYTWLLKVEYLLNGCMDLYEI